MSGIYKISLILIVAVIAVFAQNRIADADTPDDIVIIANKSLNIKGISAGDIRRIFLKEKSSIKGVKIIPINARSTSALRKAFSMRVLGMSRSEEISYWEDQKIRSGMRKPTELSNTVKAVFSIKTGISYCYRKDFNPAVAQIILSI